MMNIEYSENMTIHGQRLRDLMKDRGIDTQSDLFDRTGVDQSVINKIISGKRKKPKKPMQQIAAAFGMTYDEQKGFIKNESPKVPLDKSGLSLDKSSSTDVNYPLPPRELRKSMRVVPMYGRIAAGEPVETWEFIEDYYVPAHLWASDRFVLKVSGNSMDPELRDGDIILMRRSDGIPVADCDNEICAVQTNGENTLKIVRLMFDDAGNIVKMRLQPINERYDTKDVLLDKPRIAGILVTTLEHKIKLPRRNF